MCKIMEGGVRRGRWNKKAPVGIILLLMCMFVPTLTLIQPSEERTCPAGDYLTEKGICCNKCSPGFKLTEDCHFAGHRSNCTQCPDKQYMDRMNFYPNCLSCRRCRKEKNEVVESPCEKHQNTKCRCADGYYKFVIDSETFECRQCSPCRPNEKEKQTCTPEKNTVCECAHDYYRVKNNCEPCKNCTAECNHHCASTPVSAKAPDAGVDVNIFAGVGAGALLLVVAGVVITYMATKWTTQRNLLRSLSEPSDASPDPCEVLIHSEEPSNNNIVTAIPQSPVSEPEQPSNLPDCVPLEVKIPDLIYTVLDLVPVLRVKQLVRSLGVRDTEIEQAELDHRSSREAHYQMLRVWAERGSRAGGRARGGLLHWPLLQELMDTLTEMHLGCAAEELQTKYGIQ